MANVILSLSEQTKNITVLLDQKDQMAFSLGDAQLVYTDLKWESIPQATGLVMYDFGTGRYKTVKTDTEITSESDNIVTSKAVYEFFNKDEKFLYCSTLIGRSEEDWKDYLRNFKTTDSFSVNSFNIKPKSGDIALGRGYVSTGDRSVIYFIQIGLVDESKNKVHAQFIGGIIESNGGSSSSIPTKTSQLSNDGDGSSKFATEDFVEKNGGKIDSISINGTKQPIDNNKNVDIELPSNIAETDKNNNFTSSQTINGTLTVNGDIVQNGESYETHAEKVYTKNDTIILREGAVGGLGADEYAGFEAEKYDGENTGVLGFGADGVARVGDKGNEQPLLTREESEDLNNGDVMVWNSETNRAEGSSEYEKTASVDNKISQLESNVNNKISGLESNINNDILELESNVDNTYLKKSGIELTLKNNGAYTLTITK